MKVKLMVVFAVVLFLCNFAGAYKYKENEKEFIEKYKETEHTESRIFLIRKLTAMKSVKGLKMFIDELCFPSKDKTPSGNTEYSTGAYNKVRMYIAFYLRYYKDIPKEHLTYGFQAVRKLVDRDKDMQIVINAMVSLSYWAKYLGKDHKALMLNSLSKKISKVEKKNKRMVWTIVKCLEVLSPAEEAIRLAERMRNMGFDPVAEERIKKILSRR